MGSGILIMQTNTFSNTGHMGAENNAYILHEKILNHGTLDIGKMLCMPNAHYSGTGRIIANVIIATEHTINHIKSSGNYESWRSKFIVLPKHSEQWGVEECDTAYSNFLNPHDAL